MNPVNAQLGTSLQSNRKSLTQARVVLFEALAGQEPQTMSELIGRCQGRLNRASIYRGITLFEKLGIVQRISIGWKYSFELTDRFAPHHHHLSCTLCGRHTPLPEDPLLEQQLRSIARSAGYEPTEHQLEIRGLCQDCQQKHTKKVTNES